MQIIILGTHRSGTSLLTRLINMMGAYVGGEGFGLTPSPTNPKGFWERQDIMEVNDALLRAVVCEWDRPLDFSIDSLDTKQLPSERVAEVERARQEMENLRRPAARRSSAFAIGAGRAALDYFRSLMAEQESA